MRRATDGAFWAKGRARGKGHECALFEVQREGVCVCRVVGEGKMDGRQR